MGDCSRLLDGQLAKLANRRLPSFPAHSAVLQHEDLSPRGVTSDRRHQIVSFDFIRSRLVAVQRYLNEHYPGSVSSDFTTPLDQCGKPAYSDDWRFVFGGVNP
jgi:hypothetical protein